MPYPVLPPPPPPIVSNEVSPQPPQLEAMVDENSAHPGVGNGRASYIDWTSCLAAPERLPSESSSLITSPSPVVTTPVVTTPGITTPGITNRLDTADSTEAGTSPSPFFCIPPQQESLSLLPLTSQGYANDAESSLSSTPMTPSQDSPQAKGEKIQDIKLPEGTEIVEELHFVLDTFNPDEYPAPNLHQLAHQPGQPAPDIFRIPLQSTTPLIPQLLAQNVTEFPQTPPLSPSSIPDLNIPDSIPLDVEVLDGRNGEALLEQTGLEQEINPNTLEIEAIEAIGSEALENIGSEALESGIESLSDDNAVPFDVDSSIVDGVEAEIPDIAPETELPNILPGEGNRPELEALPDLLPTVDSSTIDVDPAAIVDEVLAPDGEDNEGEDDGEDAEESLAAPDVETPSVPARQNPRTRQDVLDAASEAVGEDALEVTADRQVYDRNRQYFLAEGNALMTFRGALLKADMLRVNLVNQIVVAEGNAVLTRGDQVIRGNRLEYNLVQDEGLIYDAKGEVFLPQTSSDFGPNRPDTLETSSDVPLTDRLATDQPVVTATSPGGVSFGVGFSGGQGNPSRQGAAAGTVSRIRFEADEIAFRPDGWDATNVRLTNDPFSPPELEIRSRLVTFRRLDANRSELRARRPRLVLDQWLHIPLLRERAIFDSRDRNPAPFQIGFDEDDRGGLFIQRPFTPIATDDISLTLTPQFFVQHALENDDENPDRPIDVENDSSSWLDPDLYGLLGELDVRLGSKTALSGSMTLTSFDFGDNIREDELRGNVRLRRRINTGLGPHTLTSEYSYRDRLFNGTLGFQTVQKTYGVVLTSPPIRLGDSGIQLTYQGGIQRVNANIASDRVNDLLGPPPRPNNRDTLMRYQVAADLRRSYLLWAGKPLPATKDEGLRYTPNPVVPYIALIPSLRGVASFYSSGDDQPILTGRLTLAGQFGHFSRPYLDYLGFNLSYRRSTDGPESPFNFDRVADREVLSGGLTAQLFGPIRIGFRTSISLDEDEEFDNSFIIEYSRRTHGLVFRYNPDRQIGSVGLRISDFNWNGTPEPFGGSGVRTVDDGVLRND